MARPGEGGTPGVSLNNLIVCSQNLSIALLIRQYCLTASTPYSNLLLTATFLAN